MAKRRNENGQMRREEYEHQEEIESGNDDVQKGFARASADEIKKRKIIQVKRRPKKPSNTAATSNAGGSSNAFSGFSGLSSTTSSVNANPFQNFSGLAATNPPAKENPFSGFSGLSSSANNDSSTKIKPFDGFSGLSSNSVSSETPAKAIVNQGIEKAAEIPNLDMSKAPKSYNEAIELLNSSFVKFISEQLDENPSALWTEAVNDYMAHVQSISSKFSSTKPVEPSCVRNTGTKLDCDTQVSSELSTRGNKEISSNKLPEKNNEHLSSGFSFSSNSIKESNSDLNSKNNNTSTTPVFSFDGKSTSDSASSSSKPVSGFTFGSGAFNTTSAKPSTSVSSSTTPFSGFSFGASSSEPSARPQVSSSAPQESNEEEVGREEATVILKGENDTEKEEEIFFNVDRSRLLEFKADEKRWMDKGIMSSLKVLVHKSNKSARILARNSIGKVFLNSALYKGIKFETVEGKNNKKLGVSMVLLNGDGKSSKFTIKVNAEKVDDLFNALEKAAQSIN